MPNPKRRPSDLNIWRPIEWPDPEAAPIPRGPDGDRFDLPQVEEFEDVNWIDEEMFDEDDPPPEVEAPPPVDPLANLDRLVNFDELAPFANVPQPQPRGLKLKLQPKFPGNPEKPANMVDVPSNRAELRKFFLPYENSEELNLRLAHSVIMYNNKAWEVREGNVRRKHQLFNLFVIDSEGTGEHLYIDLQQPSTLPDLRNPAPRFFFIGRDLAYMFRHPARIYKQGLNANNCHYCVLDSGEERVFDGNRMIMKALDQPTVGTWTPKLSQLLQQDYSAVLSKTVGVTIKGVYYKGRKLGKLDEDRVIPDDPQDAKMPWIQSELQQVGLRI
jgi:hypothetical protein